MPRRTKKVPLPWWRVHWRWLLAGAALGLGILAGHLWAQQFPTQKYGGPWGTVPDIKKQIAMVLGAGDTTTTAERAVTAFKGNKALIHLVSRNPYMEKVVGGDKQRGLMYMHFEAQNPIGLFVQAEDTVDNQQSIIIDLGGDNCEGLRVDQIGQAGAGDVGIALSMNGAATGDTAMYISGAGAGAALSVRTAAASTVTGLAMILAGDGSGVTLNDTDPSKEALDIFAGSAFDGSSLVRLRGHATAINDTMLYIDPAGSGAVALRVDKGTAVFDDTVRVSGMMDYAFAGTATMATNVTADTVLISGLKSTDFVLVVRKGQHPSGASLAGREMLALPVTDTLFIRISSAVAGGTTPYYYVIFR